MKKITKLLAILLVFSVAAGALVACTPGSQTDDTANTTTSPNGEEAKTGVYTFTVIYEDTGLPAQNIMIGLCQGDDHCLPQACTGENGKCEYNLKKYGEEYGVWDIHIYGILDDVEGTIAIEGYTFDNDAFKTSADVHEYTLKLTKVTEE